MRDMILRGPNSLILMNIMLKGETNWRRGGVPLANSKLLAQFHISQNAPWAGDKDRMMGPGTLLRSRRREPIVSPGRSPMQESRTGSGRWPTRGEFGPFGELGRGDGRDRYSTGWRGRPGGESEGDSEGHPGWANLRVNAVRKGANRRTSMRRRGGRGRRRRRRQRRGRERAGRTGVREPKRALVTPARFSRRSSAKDSGPEGSEGIGGSGVPW